MDKDLKNPLLSEAEVTFCLIKPHAVYAGAVHEITTFLERNRFTVLAHKKLFFTEEIIRELFRSHGLPSEKQYQSMRGPNVLLELTRKNAVSVLRKLSGHDIPTEAIPGTLHYMYGVDQYHNGILVPRDRAEFKRMLEVLELWFQTYSRALTENEADPIEKAQERFLIMMGQGTSEETVEDEVEELVGYDETELVPEAQKEEKNEVVENVVESYGVGTAGGAQGDTGPV